MRGDSDALDLQQMAARMTDAEIREWIETVLMEAGETVRTLLSELEAREMERTKWTEAQK